MYSFIIVLMTITTEAGREGCDGSNDVHPFSALPLLLRVVVKASFAAGANTIHPVTGECNAGVSQNRLALAFSGQAKAMPGVADNNQETSPGGDL